MAPPVESEVERFEPLARGLYLEALLVDDDAIWYSDVVAGGIRRVGSDDVLLPGRRMIGGLVRNSDGRLLVSGAQGIAWVDPGDGASGVLIDGLGGVNELRADGRGGLYFGTIDIGAIDRGEPSRGSALYHLSVDLGLDCLAEGLVFSNGLSPSRDGALLFHNESFAGTFAYPLRPDLPLGERRLLVDKRDCDGLALDAEGNLWLSGFHSNELICISPEGEERARLPLPGDACTNVRFGGVGGRDLYVTTVTKDSVAALGRAEVPNAPESCLWWARSPVPGAPLECTAFELG